MTLLGRMFLWNTGRHLHRLFTQLPFSAPPSFIGFLAHNNCHIRRFGFGSAKNKKNGEAVIDLFKMDEREFYETGRVFQMKDDEWLRSYQRAFALTDYEPVSKLTLQRASTRGTKWLKSAGRSASVEHISQYLLMLAKYLRRFQDNSEYTKERNALINRWLQDRLPKLSSEEFFLVMASLEQVPPSNAGQFLSDDTVNKAIVNTGLERVAGAKSHQIASLFRTVRLHHCQSLDSVVPAGGTSDRLWRELERKGLPTEATDLFLTLKSLTEPISLSLSEKGGREFPLRPPKDWQPWFHKLIAQPFTNERYFASRPLSLNAATGLIGKSSGPLVSFTGQQIHSFTSKTALPFHDSPSMIFGDGNLVSFGKILNSFMALAWSSKNPQILYVREELLLQKVAFNEAYWRRFWPMMDDECRTRPLHYIARVLDILRRSTTIHHRESKKLLTSPIPATTSAWIRSCLDRCREMPHPDHLLFRLVHFCPNDAPNGVKRRLVDCCHDLNFIEQKKIQSNWALRLFALEKSINQNGNAGEVATTERIQAATTILRSDPKRISEIDFPSLHQSINSYISDLHQSTAVRDFMTALLSRPEALEHNRQPQQWLFTCYRLYVDRSKNYRKENANMRPGVAWWKALCTKLQKNESFPDKHVYHFLDSYCKLELAYPDYPLPAVLFDSLERKIPRENSPSEVISYIHQLHLIRLRDVALVRLTEERLIALTDKGGQQLAVDNLVEFLFASASLNVTLRRNWWQYLENLPKNPLPLKPITLYALLYAASLQNILFVAETKGKQVSASLISWALKKLLAECKIGYDKLYDQVKLQRLLLVFGERAIADAHPALLTYLKTNSPRRLPSDKSARLIYVKEADVWCYSVDHRQKRCQIIPPEGYWKRDGTRDDSAYFVDFAASVRLLEERAGFTVQFVNSSGRPIRRRS